MAQNVRLFCFPYGGGGASIYRTWIRSVPGWLTISPVQFPGREEKSKEPFPVNVDSLVKGLLPTFFGLQNFAFFGHSLGAVVAFELVRYLRRLGEKMPDALFVSGYPAPHLPRLRPRIAHLPRQEFTKALIENFDVSESLRLEPAILDYAYPILAADFSLVENYSYREEKPIEIPILVLGADHDREVSEEQLRAWDKHTTLPIRFHRFPGDHFYLHTATEDLLETMVNDLKNFMPH
jgi:medium-chain acyl-[acyl-carrier-protein] hydrolase